MDYVIRPAVPTDATQLVVLVKALQDYLGDGTDNFDAERFVADAFCAEPLFSLLVAEGEDELAGYALYHDAYESSFAQKGIYLADLYVSENARGRGLGKQLMQAVAKDGKARGRTFIWLVSPHEGARAFYDAIMDVKEEAIAYALTGEHFNKILETSR